MEILLAWIWLALTLTWAGTFWAPSRRAIARAILAPRHISLRRARWSLAIAATATFVVIAAITPKDKDEHPAASPGGAPSVAPAEPATVQNSSTSSPQLTKETLLAAISESGGFFSGQASISADHMKDISLDGPRLSLTVNLGEWWSVSATEAEVQMQTPMQTFYRVASRFPALETITVEFQSPAEEVRDEHGNITNPNSQAAAAILAIDCGDLRKFPASFDWGIYSLYVANRYATFVNPQLRGPWQEEVEKEVKLGNFSPPQWNLSGFSPRAGTALGTTVMTINPAR